MANEGDLTGSLIHFIYAGVASAITGLVMAVRWLFNRSVKLLDVKITDASDEAKEAKNAVIDQKLALAEFKLHVAENFASNANIKESLDRVHDRIDEGNERDEVMQDDIKKILQLVGNG